VRTTDVLDQLHATLDDWTVSDDAMRHKPDSPVPAVRPRANGRNILIQRLIERHGLDVDTAQAAVLAAERGQTDGDAALAAAEAQAVLDEIAAQFRAAFRPMMQRVVDQFRQIKEAFQHLPEAVGCNDCGKPVRPRDRPAWQSPYGPAPRRR